MIQWALSAPKKHPSKQNQQYIIMNIRLLLHFSHNNSFFLSPFRIKIFQRGKKYSPIPNVIQSQDTKQPPFKSQICINNNLKWSNRNCMIVLHNNQYLRMIHCNIIHWQKKGSSILAWNVQNFTWVLFYPLPPPMSSSKENKPFSSWTAYANKRNISSNKEWREKKREKRVKNNAAQMYFVPSSVWTW